MKTFLSSLAVVLVAGIAAAQPVQPPPRQVEPYPETVSVSGIGRSTLIPDRFTFTAGVQTVANTVDEAVNQNNAKIASVIAALKRAGATDKDIRTSNFSIFPQQDYTQGKLPRILGYQVSNNITVTRTDVGEAGKLLQAAISAGVNTSSGLTFEVSDPSRGRDEGLKAAYNDARAKAALLAQAAGRSLGRAIQINEGTQGSVTPPYMGRVANMRAQAEMAVSDVPVESGTQEMMYHVTAVFELR